MLDRPEVKRLESVEIDVSVLKFVVLTETVVVL